jgi:ADP-ribose pyrophosphatase YjhB (NUDIX family)
MDVSPSTVRGSQSTRIISDGEARLSARPLSHPQASLAHDSWRVRMRRLLYRSWPRVPRWSRRLALRLALPRHSLGVCAVIQDQRGRVLLARHTYRPSPWGLPGGFVRRREQPQLALARELSRELSEELGADAHVGPLLYAELHEPSGHLTLYFSATLQGAAHTDDVEVDGTRFVSRADAMALLGSSAAPWLASLSELRAS